MSGRRAKQQRNRQTPLRLSPVFEGRGKEGADLRLSALTAAGFVAGVLVPLVPTPAWGLPEGGTVAAGAATISTPTATSMRVDQSSDRVILDWTRFNIAANEAVHFQQPSAAAVALNRVSGQEPSAIFGSLTANGQVFLLNPSGILFGPSSRVDVGALTASTLTMTNQDFLNSQYRFTQDPSAANAAVVNQGLITAGPGGYVALLGAAAQNEGVIQAQLGSIALASGRAATLDLRGDGLIQFVITDAVSGAVTGPDGTPLASSVSNTGTLQADGGMVTLHAKAAAGLVRSVVNQEGVVRATSLVNRGGVIKLIAEGGDQAMVSNTGTLDVSAGEPNATPGTITVHSDHEMNLAGAVTAGAGAVALSAPEIQSTADISASAVTVQTTDLTLTGGSVTAATGSIDVADGITQTGGSVAAGAASITVGGNWTHAGGTFDPGTSTVVFTDATQSSSIRGDTTFYNLTSITPDKKLFFEAGATQTVLGAVTMKGIKSHLIDLRSTDPGGGQWRLDPRGQVDVSFVHLGDALNLSPTLIKALPSNSYGNNTGWDTDPIWTAVGPGNWSTDANWDTGLQPGAADTVTFDATSVTNSTVDAGFAGTIANLNINAGYTGTIDLARSLTITGTYTQAAGTLTAAGNALTIDDGNFTLSGGTFTAPSSTLSFNATGADRTFTISGGTFTHNSGIVQFGNSNSFVITLDVPSNQSFNNVTVDMFDGNPGFPLSVASGKTLTVDGTLTLTNGYLGAGTGNIDAKGAIVVGAGFDGATAPQGTLLLINGAGDQSFVVPSGANLPRMTLNSASTTMSFAPGASANLTGDFTLQAGTLTGGNSTLTMSDGNFTLSGGTFTAPSATLAVVASGGPQTFTISGGTFTHNSGTVQFGDGNSFGITLDVPSNQAFNNVTVNMFSGTSGFPLSVANGKTLSVNGTLTLTNGYLGAGTGTIDANGVIVVGAGFDGAAAALLQGTLLLIDGAGDQSFVVPSGASLPRMTLNSAGTTMSFAAGASANLTGDFTLQAGTFTSTSGTLTVASSYSPQTFTISGGTFNHNNGTVQFGDANNYDITVDVPSNQPFNHVTVNMFDGVAFPLTIASGKTMTVVGTFTHTDGAINTGTIAAQGHVTINAGADGGTGLLSFTGTAAQTYTQSGDVVDGLVTVNKASGTVTLASAATWNAASQNLTVTSGTLDLAGFALSTGTLTVAAAGTVLQGAGIITGSNISNAGTFTGGSAAITLSGDVTLTGGTFTSTSGTLTVQNDAIDGIPVFTHTAGGTFNHNNGTVAFTGTSNIIIDVATSETFNNLTFSTIGGGGATIASGDTLVVLGTLTHSTAPLLTGTIEARGNVTVGAGAGGGDATISFLIAGDQTITSGGGTTGKLNINKPSGTVSVSGADLGIFAFTLAAGTFTAPTGILTIQNDGIDGIPVFTHTAGGTFSHNNGTVVFTGTSNISIDVATSETFNNLTFSTIGGGGVTLSSGDTLVVLGTLTHASSLIFTGTIEARGNVVIGAGAAGR